MTTATIGSIILAILSILGVVIKSYLESKNSKSDTAYEVLENVEKANKAINRAKSDSAISDKLREKYKLK